VCVEVLGHSFVFQTALNSSLNSVELDSNKLSYDILSEIGYHPQSWIKFSVNETQFQISILIKFVDYAKFITNTVFFEFMNFLPISNL
jgi:hypothetical protein